MNGGAVDSSETAVSAKQTVVSRIFWFGVGGCISVAINAGIFHLTNNVWHWTDRSSYALSLTVVTIVFSVWNYLLNFRTTADWRHCLARYLGAIAICYVLNFLVTMTGFKQLSPSQMMKYGIIATVQVGMSGLKFLLYHFWVYPRGQEPEREV